MYRLTEHGCFPASHLILRNRAPVILRTSLQLSARLNSLYGVQGTYYPRFFTEHGVRNGDTTTNTKMIANAAAGGMDRLRQHSYICPSYSNKEHAGWSLSIFVLATKLMTIAHLADSRTICCIAG